MKTKKSCTSKSKCKRSTSKKGTNKSRMSKLSKTFKKSKINKMSKKSRKSLSKSLVKSKCKHTNKITKVNFNIVLDLDNTIISSLTREEYEKRKINNTVKFTSICDGIYYTLGRPYLEDFLKYIFARFHVSVWTAASKDYATEIIKKFITKGKKERKLKGFLYDVHCKESMDNINPKTMKDLRYLYISNKSYNKNNTVIIDDLKEVLNNNKKNSIDSEYFNASNNSALKDTFLLNLMKDLDIVYQTLCKK
jgi:hypothetical protein